MKKSMVSCLVFSLMVLLAVGLASANTIKIGVIYPLTGGAAAEGRELRAGAELAAEIVNNSNAAMAMNMAKNAGIKSQGGAKIELIFKDHEGNPTLGADLAKKLILDDKVVGHHGLLPQRRDQNGERRGRAVRHPHDQ